MADDLAIKIVADQVASVANAVEHSRTEVLAAIRDHKADVRASLDQFRQDMHTGAVNEEAATAALSVRVTALEKFRWQLAGGLFVLSIVLGVVQAIVLKLLL